MWWETGHLENRILVGLPGGQKGGEDCALRWSWVTDEVTQAGQVSAYGSDTEYLNEGVARTP